MSLLRTDGITAFLGNSGPVLLSSILRALFALPVATEENVVCCGASFFGLPLNRLDSTLLFKTVEDRSFDGVESGWLDGVGGCW